MPDRYETLEEIGRGGMGVVYRARDLKLGREVALKELRKGLLRDDDAKRRFEREARALSRFDHPAIVRVYEVGVDSEVPFLVMNFVEGEGLRDRLDRCGSLAPKETARLGRRLASALSHTHKEDVLHRDLKPENILLKEGHIDRAVLADFGIAHLLEETTTATRMGTPAYMSPEQLEGESLDARSDVYGLGAVLYECASEKPPYGRGDMRQVLYRMVSEDPEPLEKVAPDQPSWVVQVVEKCLFEAPEDRYGSAEALVEALHERLEEVPTGPSTLEMSGVEESSSPKLSIPDSVGTEMWSDGLDPLFEALRDPEEVKELNMRHSNLTQIPSSIARLTNLERLILYCNDLKSLPSSIGQLRSLNTFRLSNNDISELPSSVGQLNDLRELDLRWNALEELPSSIGKLKNLKVLDLRRNNLEELPEQVVRMECLETLCLQGNSLTKIPQSIGNLRSLERLYLGGNDLKKLPYSIGDLTSLKELYLWKNALKALPSTIAQLESLREMHIGWNALTKFPSSIGRLTKLKELDVRGNSLPKGTIAKIESQLPDAQVKY